MQSCLLVRYWENCIFIDVFARSFGLSSKTNLSSLFRFMVNRANFSDFRRLRQLKIITCFIGTDLNKLEWTELWLTANLYLAAKRLRGNTGVLHVSTSAEWRKRTQRFTLSSWFRSYKIQHETLRSLVQKPNPSPTNSWTQVFTMLDKAPWVQEFDEILNTRQCFIGIYLNTAVIRAAEYLWGNSRCLDNRWNWDGICESVTCSCLGAKNKGRPP